MGNMDTIGSSTYKKIKRDKLKYDLKPEAMTDVFKCRKLT